MDVGTVVTLGVTAGFLVVIAVVVVSEYRARRADRRAKQLVRDVLTPAELAQVKRCGHLDVESRLAAGRVYRIPAGPGMVSVLESGVPVAQLCMVPARAVPEREHLVIHKLLLEGAEAEYWQKANHFRTYPRLGPSTITPTDPRVEVWTGAPPGVIGYWMSSGELMLERTGPENVPSSMR